ncbi:ketoacyl-ACP synthase III family protein (plasmid) [Streptomyces galilaeus]
MKAEGVFIDSVGVFLPDWISAEQGVTDGLYDEEVYKAGGLTGTHIAGDLPALDMAVTAARRALERSGAEPGDIESHIHSGVYYQGPDGSYPPAYILRELGIGSVPSLHIRQGCNGMLAALEIAVGQITGAAGAETVLLTTAQNFTTPLIDRWRGFGDSYILADGAAAAVVSAEGASPGCAPSTPAPCPNWRSGIAATSRCCRPGTAPARNSRSPNGPPCSTTARCRWPKPSSGSASSTSASSTGPSSMPASTPPTWPGSSPSTRTAA